MFVEYTPKGMDAIDQRYVDNCTCNWLEIMAGQVVFVEPH